MLLLYFMDVSINCGSNSKNIIGRSKMLYKVRDFTHSTAKFETLQRAFHLGVHVHDLRFTISFHHNIYEPLFITSQHKQQIITCMQIAFTYDGRVAACILQLIFHLFN